MKTITLLALTLMFGCGSFPSKYQESKGGGKEGYADESVDLNLKKTSFLGNSSTKKEKAQLFAKFRAIEVCSESDKKYTHILTVRDRTFEKEQAQTTTYYPTYGYGVSPYYGGVGMYSMYGPMETHTWNESYTYPFFEVYFECVDKALDSRMSFKTLSQSQVEKFVQDLKGAVQVDKILPESPNKNQLKVADIIIRANGVRVGNQVELYQAHRNNLNKKLQLEIVREGVKKNVTANFLDVTDKVAEAQKEIVKEACKQDGIKGKRPLCK